MGQKISKQNGRRLQLLLSVGLFAFLFCRSGLNLQKEKSGLTH